MHLLHLYISSFQNEKKKAVHLVPVCTPLCLQYPPGYLSAMANKTKKEACARPGRGGRGKHYPGRGRPRRQRKIKEKEEIDEDEEDMQPVASVEEEEEPPSNGEQKTTRDRGGCFHSRCERSSTSRETSSTIVLYLCADFPRACITVNVVFLI